MSLFIIELFDPKIYCTGGHVTWSVCES